MKTIFKNEFGTMNYSSEYALTEHIWASFTESMTSKDFKTFLLIWKEFTMSNKVNYHLIDAREFYYTILPEEQEWVAKQIVKPATERGLKKMAQLLPEDIFAKVSVVQTMDENIDAVEEEVSKELETMDFNKRRKAKLWLLSDRYKY